MRRLQGRLPADLLETLASEVLQRLSSKTTLPRDRAPSPSDLDRLCQALIDTDDQAAGAIVAGLLEKRVPPEEIYLDHLAPAARTLGEWWNEDRASFTEVAIGTGRLLSIMRGMRHLFVAENLRSRKSALFASVPGESHTVGVQMATDLIRQDGWLVSLKTGLTHDALLTEIEHSDCSVVGLSVGGQHSIEALSRLVVALHVSCPHLPILVAGSDIASVRRRVRLMDVDAIADDLDDAKVKLATLLEGVEPRA